MAWSHARFAGPLLLTLAACSSADSASTADGGDAGNTSDANPLGDDDSGKSPNDGAVTSCSPASVQSYSPRWTPPKAHTSSCTAAQIDSYAACITSNDPTSAACEPWLASGAGVNADCRTCFTDSNSTDPSWGPIVDTDSVRQINIAGCLALVSGDTGGTGCAGQYQALQGCESAACATNCANASTAQLGACVNEADNSGCSNYLSSAECVNDAGAADVCFGPQGGTFAQLFSAVAAVFCLSTADAGAGNGDAGDAGDGG